MNTKLLEQVKPKFFTKTNSKQILELVRARKFKITDHRTINYTDSPTGVAYIGLSKKPLQEVKGGYGYKGVLLQTDNRTLIQCHICGKWSRKISGPHLDSHKITKNGYQQKFGLLKGTALVSDATSYKYELAGIKKVTKYPEQSISKTHKVATMKAVLARKKDKVSNKIEHQNRYSICEKQLGFRLIDYLNKFKSLPSRSSKNDGRLIGKALYRRFGSLNNGYKHYGLPAMYRQGTNVELNSPDGKQLFYNYNKDYNRDRVFGWMQEHCPVLQQSLNIFAN